MASDWLRIDNAVDDAVKAGMGTNTVDGREIERQIVANSVPLFSFGVSRQMLLLEAKAGHGKSTITSEFCLITEQIPSITVVKTAASANHGSFMFFLW
jgi:hypothetical protein